MHHNMENCNAQEAQRDDSELQSHQVDKETRPQEDFPRSSSPSIVVPIDNANEKQKDVEAAGVTTTASSIAPVPVKVPRSKRRGLFGRFSILAE
jgi:hypothetical protein